ncbi:MAG: hypothetical protein J6S75_12455, partial [Thermoguttaceae bacterium]|nr:hypothetical protein [Thermoguttaceae bacterium]
DTDGALADYNRTLEKHPNDPIALANRMRLLSDIRRGGETGEAAAHQATEEAEKPSGEDA